MDIELLKNFLVVADKLSISRATEVVKITQPALSRQIAQLEKELKVQLFERNTRSLELTKDGFLFVRRANEILELYDITTSELLAGKNKKLTGNVKIGMGDLKSVQEIPAIIKAFKAKNPLVKFHLYTFTADIAVEKLERGSLDIGILMEPLNLDKFDFLPLPVKEELGILMRPDDALALKSYVQPRDLSNKPLIVAEHEAAKKQIQKWFAQDNSKMKIAFRTNLPTSSAMLVGNGLGYAFLVEGAVEYWNQELLTYRPLRPSIEYSSVLAWKKKQPQNAAVERFIEFCKEWYLNSGKY